MEAVAVLVAVWDHRHVHDSIQSDRTKKRIEIGGCGWSQKITVEHKFLQRQPNMIVHKSTVLLEMTFDEVDETFDVIRQYGRAVLSLPHRFADGVADCAAFNALFPLKYNKVRCTWIYRRKELQPVIKLNYAEYGGGNFPEAVACCNHQITTGPWEGREGFPFRHGQSFSLCSGNRRRRNTKFLRKRSCSQWPGKRWVIMSWIVHLFIYLLIARFIIWSFWFSFDWLIDWLTLSTCKPVSAFLSDHSARFYS